MRRALAELQLGVQVALAGRTSRLRTLLTAAGVALGVLVLALAACVPHAVNAREARARSQAPVTGVPGPGLQLLTDTTAFRGVTIAENAVQVTGGAGGVQAVPMPPGVTRIPGPGEMVVSPEVAALLRGPGGAELRARLGARVVGTVGPGGLTEPRAAVVFRGSRGVLAHGGARVRRFGVPATTTAGDVIITLLTIVVVIALLLPVGAFVMTAARFGAEERDRRLAAIRLVGADRLAATRIAAGEALVGAVTGLAAGAGLFLGLRSLIASAGIGGVDVFTADLTPASALAVLVAVLVPLSAVLAALVSMRRVAAEPLGVTRRGGQAPRRPGWRLVIPALGFALLAPLVGSANRLDGAGGQIEASAGVVLVLVGVVALLPWVVEAVVRRCGDGPLPWLLAIRRLRREEGSTGRVVGAIGLAVAGAIALSIVFGAARREVATRLSPAQAGTLQVQLNAGSRAGVRRDRDVLRRVPGVVSVTGPAAGTAPRGTLIASVRVADHDRAAAARVRDTAAALDPLAQVQPAFVQDTETRLLGELRTGLFAGAVVVLMMIGASLLVAAAEGLRERRPVLAVLGAFGARRSTLVWSVLWQAAIPVAAGLVLAAGLGIALGTVLSTVVHLAPDFDWGAIALTLGAGVAVIAAVTALTLPTVSRMMRPDALRVE